MIRRFLGLLVAPALLAAAVVPTARAGAICIELPRREQICLDVGEPGQDPCEPSDVTGDQQRKENPLCATGPAGCVAIGVYVDVSPVPILLPTGAVVQLSRSVANARFQFGSSHADAHQERTDLPGTLAQGVVESECNASVEADPRTGKPLTHADGKADTAQFSLNLAPSYSIPLELSFDVLCEEGSSTNAVGDLPIGPAGTPNPVPGPPPYGPCQPPPASHPVSSTGGNRGDVANVVINGLSLIPTPPASFPPNTAIDLPPIIAPGLVGTLYLNEQFGPFFDFTTDCVRYEGDALRLVLRNPITSATVATVIVSWVSTCTIPFFEPQ